MKHSTCQRVSSLESHSLENRVPYCCRCWKTCFKTYDIDSMVVRISTGSML